jgi:ferredoxin-NADP reductase
MVPDILDRDVYLCGPVSMMDRVETTLRTMGVADEQIHLERFTY